MNKEKYLANRKKLMDEAQILINDGKTAEANAKIKEVEALDAKWDETCKAQANFNALNGSAPQMPNLANAVANVSNGMTAGNVSLDGTPAVTDVYDTPEYKNAFMRNVAFGAAMPKQFVNTDANTKTSDVGSVIPTTTLQKIVEKMESIGMILPLVTRTAYKGGVAVPTSSAKPTATWVAEGAGSDKQKKATGSITFGYYKLSCAVSMSFETTQLTYPMFESIFVAQVAQSMTKAKETAIIKGSGSGQPKGILKETAVTGQNIDVAKASDITYKTLVSAEAALPQAYDSSAVWCMTKNTFVNKVLGLVDKNDQPVCRVNAGLSGKPEYFIFGRRVVLIGDYMDSYVAEPTADTIVAFMFNFADYLLNEPVAMYTKRYTDNDTDDEIVKAIALCDGKVIDKNSLVTITKKST
jgi:HK97 family phage major capsid protein